MMIRFRRSPKGMFRLVLSILFVLAVPFILSSVLSCRVSVQGEPYGPGPRPAHLSRLDGQWFFNANNFPGRLEFYWTRNAWTGRMVFDNIGRWIELTDIFLDSRTGQLQFTAENQIYSGTLSGNRIVGTFAGGFPWEAWRH
jgi:hypothetical protein